jgi:hypothetical protein
MGVFRERFTAVNLETCIGLLPTIEVVAFDSAMISPQLAFAAG